MIGVIKTISVEQRLVEWGKWSRDAGLRLGHSSPMYQIMRDNVEARESRDSYDMDDDEAMVINDAICLLAKTKWNDAAALLTYYVRRKHDEERGIVAMAFEDVAEHLCMSRNMARERIKCAESWLEGHLMAYYQREAV